MRRSSVVAASLLVLSFLAALQSCSAGGSPKDGTGVTQDQPGQGPKLPNPITGGGSPAADPFMIDDQSLVDANGKPRNVGSESACDGLDENMNGITDDVDKGKDGLCDCLHIGFLGELASDAGNNTGAFESWLNARSDVAVRHLGARDTITPEALADLQVLVVGNLRQRGNAGFSAAELEAFRQWIDSGGGVMTLAGYTANANDMVPTVALLQPTGLGYQYQGLGAGVLGVVMNGPPPVIVHGIVAPDHPTMEGITALGVFNAYPVTGDGTVIVREGTYNLAMAKELGGGHVYAFSDEWITQDVLWRPLARPQTPCQQSCTECANQCANCDTQCANCQMQPCEGGQQAATDGGVCRRGCDQSCTQCGTNCQTCEQACTACSALEQNDTLDIPRFWLNVIRWLTPANECQVPVPDRIVY
ncbi:MAG: hypothetical protein ABI895_08870 [Deltaproteobacteria bacterium]